jgi:circadian clock protein KaiB
MATTLLKLFVAGETPRARQAIADLRSLCEQGLAGDSEIVIIDVLKHPELAAAEQILATPTLVKHAPSPLRRIIGDLSDRERVIAWLGLEAGPAPM